MPLLSTPAAPPCRAVRGWIVLRAWGVQSGVRVAHDVVEDGTHDQAEGFDRGSLFPIALTTWSVLDLVGAVSSSAPRDCYHIIRPTIEALAGHPVVSGQPALGAHMPFWDKKDRKVQASEEEVARSMRELMAREPVTGPEARPWRERRTIKPFPEYRPQRWDHWKFSDPGNDGVTFGLEEMVGTIFPDDFIIVDGQWRKVLEISTTADPEDRQPVIFFEHEQRRASANREDVVHRNHSQSRASDDTTAEESELDSGSSDVDRMRRLQNVWPAVRADLNRINYRIDTLFQQIELITVQGSTVVLASPYEFHWTRVVSEGARPIIEKVISSHLGQPVTIICLSPELAGALLRQA